MLRKNGIAGGYKSTLAHWFGHKDAETSYFPLKRVKVKRVYRKLIPIAEAELWVREKTGKNDGARVEEYQASVGLKKGDPYCAAFVSFVFMKAGYIAPRTGWSPALFPVARLVKAAAPGNVFGIYFPALKRIGHCGFVARLRGSWIEALEANTNKAGSREGDGVYRKFRHRKSISKYAEWRFFNKINTVNYNSSLK